MCHTIVMERKKKHFFVYIEVDFMSQVDSEFYFSCSLHLVFSKLSVKYIFTITTTKDAMLSTPVCLSVYIIYIIIIII